MLRIISDWFVMRITRLRSAYRRANGFDLFLPAQRIACSCALHEEHGHDGVDVRFHRDQRAAVGAYSLPYTEPKNVSFELRAACEQVGAILALRVESKEDRNEYNYRLELPRSRALEVLRFVRDTAALKSIPVVMLTSSKEEQDLLRSYEPGVNAYVLKPVEFQQFVSAIAGLGCSGQC